MSESYFGALQVDKKAPEQAGAQLLVQPTFDSRIKDRRLISYAEIRQYRCDPTIRLAKMAVVAPIIHTPWDYEVTSKAPSEAKNLLVDMLEELRDEFLTIAVYGALDFGWAPFEVSYTRENGLTRFNKFKPLLQDYTDVVVYLSSGDFAGFINDPSIIAGTKEPIYIRESNAMVVNLEWEGTDWYGESIFNSLQDTQDSWDVVEAVANRFDKKISGAIWVVNYPVGSTTYNGKKTSNDIVAQSILNRLEASTGVAIPSDLIQLMEDDVDKKMKGKWSIELVTANASQQSSFIDRQKYLDALKMRAFGLPERSVLEGTHGTKAEADTHTDLALTIVGHKHRLIANRLNQQAVNSWLKINYGPKAINSVKVVPAPVTSARFAIIKDLYRLIMQNDSEGIEKANINLEQVRKQLGVPSTKE